MGQMRPNKKEKAKKITLFCLLFFGASDEARTRYLHLGKVALYQMSYTRISKEYVIISPLKCQAYFCRFPKIFSKSLAGPTACSVRQIS